MDKVKTSRAIIETNYNGKKSIITIKRTKYKNGNIQNEYYTLPGGHVESNETSEETVIREALEELDVNISIEEKVLSIYNKDLDRYEEFFICNIKSGEVKEGNGPEWTDQNIEKYGSFDIVYINIEDIGKYNILPIEAKELLIKKYGII